MDTDKTDNFVIKRQKQDQQKARRKTERKTFSTMKGTEIFVVHR